MPAEPRPPGPAQLFDLTGRTALVTGASRGIGWQIAQALAAAGAHVVMNARAPEALESRAAQMAGWGLSAEAVAGDVAAEGMARALVDGALDRHGRLDILVSNVATSVRKPFLDQCEAEFARVIDVALTAGWRLAHAAAPAMAEAGFGRMIFISSINAILARPGIHGYVAAKSALEGLVRALAVELAPSGITANAIAPGYFLTDGNKALRTERPEFEGQIAGRIPAGRWGRTEDLAAAALALAAPAAAYTTGTVQVIDGGLTVAL